MKVEVLRTIRLYGVLGSRFGRVHRLAVSTAGEAIRALGILIPGFEKFLAESQNRGLTYSVFVGKKNLGVKEMLMPSDDDIRIAPIVIGSKQGGLFQTIIGIVLVVVGTFVPGMQWLVPIGASLAIGGVIQMLSPQAKGLGSADNPENKASYNFNGPVNTSAQGNPHPLLYGEMDTGSAVISAGIYAEDRA